MTSLSNTRTTLASLRSVLPQRVVSFDEAKRIAELQACKLRELISDPDGIREHHVAGLPRISVTFEDIAVSGMTHWNGRRIIAISKHDAPARQRFTLLHEFKHVIDHGATALLYRGDTQRTSAQQAEAVADYFAGCALVGKRELKSAWGNHVQRVEDLADHFGVSIQAIQVRLAQTGLDVIADRIPSPRCARPISTPAGRAQRFRTVRSKYPRRSYA